MQIDIKGKINEKKLAYSNTLLPLFEAIVNSIQAIEEDSSTITGIIEIDIVRSTQKKIEIRENEDLPEIIDFVIKDNGIGFNEKNFDSFNYAHSTYKYQKGGKGIGRFTWLRAYGKAEIESRYKQNGQWNLRKFKFEPTKKGIESHSLTQVNSTEERYTTVALRGLKSDYRKWCNNNPEDIALKIIEHAFVYFLNTNCPRILINDLGKTIVVNDLFKLFTKGQVKTNKIKVRDNTFTLSLVKLYSRKADNKIHYCANTREVTFDKISNDIPEIDNFLYDKEGNRFSISVYVEGAYLDNNVNDERTSITFAKGEVEFPDETSQEELRKEITSTIYSEFEDQIEKLAQTRFTKVKEFVSQHPRYKQLLKYKPNQIKKIPSTLNEEKMELELFKIQQELELEVKQEAKQILRFIESDGDKESFSKSHQELYAKIIEVGNSKLSEYVIHRKLVLDLFSKFLKEKAPEKAVHNLIFPLQTLSDELGFEDHNLWMIDEKLSYHKYLASDKKFRKIKEIESESSERPDLLIFNKPFAFTNDEKPYESIVIVEFKRPMRDDYSDKENPITQVNRYAREVINGIAKDKNKREFDIRQNTPIYAYIVCDLTTKLKASASDAGYKLLPSGDGYFFFNDNYNMYVEIMSFDKILKDSNERNRVLFEKLNLT
ncbi:ATP-binding protein [uncultured Algoriphagus sp.]|uniref:ATP-binding protein n=1 Tax=uncultured Algoriphagus sp. TaxID=417365 RepID=UPI0030EB9890|tara:strand:+ start:3510 stop:5486 length:1977 start_codon:yes stop_codon:yes gene_type:complete